MGINPKDKQVTQMVAIKTSKQSFILCLLKSITGKEMMRIKADVGMQGAYLSRGSLRLISWIRTLFNLIVLFPRLHCVEFCCQQFKHR